jgi:hypothetical protein
MTERRECVSVYCCLKGYTLPAAVTPLAFELKQPPLGSRSTWTESHQERLRFVSGIHLNEAFLHSVTRRATKDAVVSVKKVAFEVPQVYCGQQVEILFTPQDLNHLFLQPPHGGERIRIEPVQLIDNSRIPRKQNQHGSIDFSQFVKE